MSKILALVLTTALLSGGVPMRAQAEDAGGADVATAAEQNESAGLSVMPAADDGSMGDAELQAMGCVVVAGAGMAATLVAGPSEVIMLWGGGMLIPSSAATVWLTLFTQIGVSGCALGAIATPTVLWMADQSSNITTKLSQSLGLEPSS